MNKLVRCSRHDADQILSILNEAIVNGTAIYDYKPRPTESMAPWFDAKERHNYPVIGIKDESGSLLAFGSFGQFRAWPAYKYTIEHSLYVRADQRGKGLGTEVLIALEEAATSQGYHTMVAGIDAGNTTSIGLHAKRGFEQCGIIRHAGFKFNNWLDLAFYQKILEAPENPKDG